MNIKRIIAAMANLNGTIYMCADGFIDEVWELVDSRASLAQYTPVSRMTHFGHRIIGVGTGGMGIELVKKRRDYGGFTANIGYATARLGINTTMAGLFGTGEVDPVFAPVQAVSNMITMGDAAVTHALEFDDGKILMTHMGVVLEVDWNRLVQDIGIFKLTELITKADIIGIGYWSCLPDFDNMVEQACALIPQDGKARRFFFDFADVRKRDTDSLVRTLGILKQLNAKCPMTLSMNEHEAAIIFELQGETLDDVGRCVADKTEAVRIGLGLDELVIHTPQYAAAAYSKEPPALMPQKYCEKPVRTAGAGDTFNGGYIAATMAGLDITERLFIANETVSFFLNTGNAPNRKDLNSWLDSE